MKYLIILLTMISCTTPTTDKDIIKAVVVQKSSTQVIDKEAKNIIKVTQVPVVKQSAKIILSENDKLKSNIDVLAGAGKALSDKDKLIEEWKDKYNSRIAAFVLILQMIGSIAIPVGLFLAFKISKGYFVLVVIGLSLIISGMVINWILTHELIILGSLAAVALFTVARMYYSQSKATKAAVRLAEDLKPHVNKHVIDKLVGHGGSVRNDDITKNIINNCKK